MGLQWFEVVQSRGGFAEVHGGFEVGSWWFAVVRGEFEVTAVVQSGS